MDIVFLGAVSLLSLGLSILLSVVGLKAVLSVIKVRE